MREVIFRGEGFELPLLQSAVIPAAFRHGFTSRAGGVSRAPFDSLNLGGRWGDSAVDIAENRRRLDLAAAPVAGVAAVAPTDETRIFFASQVHGTDSTVVGDAAGRVEDVARVPADAVIGAASGVSVGVTVADCVPVLIADERAGLCAAVHAGWRGTVAGVLSATLWRLINQLGARPGDLRVAIGPAIGPCCFEVGPEVVAAVEVAFPGARAGGAIVTPGTTATASVATAGEAGARPHVDLWRLNRMAAESVGVPADAIDVAGLCTSCLRERFFSYRRDGGKTGQLAAFIGRLQEPRSTTP